VAEPEAASSDRLMEVLRDARESIVESQKHWGAVQHLTGDRRNQRRYRELLQLLDAIIRDTENTASVWARDKLEDASPGSGVIPNTRPGGPHGLIRAAG
jgi:hypothetical protein